MTSYDRLKNVPALMTFILLFSNRMVWRFGRHSPENAKGDNDAIRLFCNCNSTRWGKTQKSSFPIASSWLFPRYNLSMFVGSFFGNSCSCFLLQSTTVSVQVHEEGHDVLPMTIKSCLKTRTTQNVILHIVQTDTCIAPNRYCLLFFRLWIKYYSLLIN